MEIFKTIVHQYCPVLSKNVAIEKSIDVDNNLHSECLNMHQCECKNGECVNKLISACDIKIPSFINKV